MHVVDRESLEALVREAVAALPQHFRDRIENVSFAVEEWAGAVDLGPYRHSRTRHAAGHLPRRSSAHRTSGYNLAMPDIIGLFQQPLQRMARDAEHLAALVEHMVRHEIAHYFGISDRRLRELGAY